MNSTNKVCFISGAGSGIGAACAELFAKSGYELALLDLNEDKLKKTEQKVSGFGKTPLLLGADVSSSSDVAAAFAKIDKHFGRIDVAVNNAGITGPTKSFVQISEADLDKILAVNLGGVIHCMKQELPRMLARKSGSIVNLGSVFGLVGCAGAAAYCASKHAVIGLTKAVALEHAKHGIRINAVCPGGVDTPLLGTMIDAKPGLRELVLGLHPMGRLSSPEEIAPAIFWMASDQASFMTGQTLAIDGGYLAS